MRLDELRTEEQALESLRLRLLSFCPARDEYKPITPRASGLFSGHLWEQLSLPWLTNGLLVNLCNSFPVAVKKQIVVIHDAAVYAVPDGFTRKFVWFYRLLYWTLKFKPSTKIMTVSEFSRREIARYTGLPIDRITVNHCGADHWNQVQPDLSVIDRMRLQGRRYLLAVASANPNKNLERLIAAYASLNRPDIPLILAGGQNQRVFSTNGGSDVPGIVRAGYVTDAELAALYQHATAFVFPSLYEGFGFPPLEAMTFGCPVISSREASLPEVCGEAARYCDARDTADIARAISELLDDESIRQTLITAGFDQVKKFTWKATARRLAEIVRTFGD